MTLSASTLDPVRRRTANRISRRITGLGARAITQWPVIVVASALSGTVSCRDIGGHSTREQTSPAPEWVASAPWTVRVCRSESSRVDMKAGQSKAISDFFATWHIDERMKSYPLPAEVQGLDRVYVRIETPSETPTEACVVYRGDTKKRMKFDHWSQEGLVSSADKDTCGC